MPEKGHRKRIYLDYASTTPVDERVLEAMLPYFSEKFGNVSNVHSWGQEAKQGLVGAREKVAEILGVAEDEIIFTGGGTESVNLALKGVAEAYSFKGRHIVSSAIEHHAVLETLGYLEDERGFEVTYVGVDENGIVDLEEFKEALREDTILASVMYANNEMGAIQPVAELGRIAREKGVLFHSDACQAPCTLEVNAEKMNVDLMTLNSSKIYGPKGVGMLYVKAGVEMVPLIHGGGQEFGLRGGTENVAGIVGFAKALELAQGRWKEEAERLGMIRDVLIERILGEIEETYLNGPSGDERLASNVNISFGGIEGESMLLRLDMEGVAVSSGAACSSNDLEPSHVLKAMGISDERTYSSLRFSLGKFVEMEDIEAVLDRVKGVVRDLRGILH